MGMLWKGRCAHFLSVHFKNYRSVKSEQTSLARGEMVWEAKAGLRQIVFADRGNQTGEVQCCAVIGDSHRVGLKPL